MKTFYKKIIKLYGCHVKKLFDETIPMDEVFEFPIIIIFCKKIKLHDKNLINERLCKSQKFCLPLLWESYVGEFN